MKASEERTYQATLSCVTPFEMREVRGGDDTCALTRLVLMMLVKDRLDIGLVRCMTMKQVFYVRWDIVALRPSELSCKVFER